MLGSTVVLCFILLLDLHGCQLASLEKDISVVVWQKEPDDGLN
jgi:hypothetical protein